MSTDNLNSQTTSGDSLITDKNGQTASFPELELLQQKNRYLEKLGELASRHGVDRVERWMQFGGFHQPAIATIPSRTTISADLLGEVEKLGLELNPNLITLIATSSVMQVKTAIAKYKSYRPQKNPEGLFYTILKNEPKSNNSNF